LSWDKFWKGARYFYAIFDPIFIAVTSVFLFCAGIVIFTGNYKVSLIVSACIVLIVFVSEIVDLIRLGFRSINKTFELTTDNLVTLVKGNTTESFWFVSDKNEATEEEKVANVDSLGWTLTIIPKSDKFIHMFTKN
jgi:ABC-type multidrug transport system fused ATPase/permease subunit